MNNFFNSGAGEDRLRTLLKQVAALYAGREESSPWPKGGEDDDNT